MEIFREAVAVPPHQRPKMILDRAGHDASLLAEVEAMLRHDVDPVAGGGEGETGHPIRTGAGIDLAHPSSGVDATLVLADGADAALPRLAGHYRIIRVIGEGGMGVVYEAEQTLPRRPVALKAIRSGLMGRQVLRRFAREAHILGRLAHPGIAQIYEAGIVDDGPADQAYLVMEYVDGQPLTQHAKDHALSVRERMELMARVCDAVQHAHQRRVIHRDLKPANILVDPSGQPKVLDFGVAALSTYGADGESGADASLETIGSHIVGTLAYMPPEQLEAGAEDPDTRNDVYSLGVVLFELLGGRLPLEVHSLPFVQAARAIQTERPARLGSIDRTLRGDPEIIVAKALEKERSARYQSAAELADDLRRCVAGEPIVARAASLGYVLRKAVHRHRVTVSLVTAAAIALSALGVYAGVEALQNRRLARELAVELSDSRIERARLLARTDQASAAEEQLWTELAQRPDSRLARWALWDLYSRSPCLATLPSRDASAFDAAFSPDGSMVAVANRPGGGVEIWDASFTSLLRAIDLKCQRALAVAFSPDGRRLATGDSDGRLCLWNVADGTPAATRAAHKDGVSRVVYSPDGRLIATAGRDARVRLWSAPDAEPVRDLAGHEEAVDAIAFAPDSRTIASGSRTSMRLWDVAGGQCLKTFLADNGARRLPTTALAFSPDGGKLYSGGTDHYLKIWDARSLDCLATRDDLPGFPFSIVPSRDSREIYVANDGVEVRDASDGRLIRTLTTPDGTRRSLALSPAEDRIVTTSMRGRVSLIETGGSAGRTVLETGVGVYVWPAFSPDCSTLALPDSVGHVRLTRVGDWDEHRDLVGSTSLIRCVTFSRDGSSLVSGANDGEIRVWDVSSGTTRATAVLSPGKSVYQVAISPDGRTLLAGSGDGHAALWKLPALEPLGELDLNAIGTRPGGVFAVAWSPDSRRYSLGTGSATLGVWRMGNPHPEGTFVVDDSQIALAFSPDGRRLLVGGDKAIIVLDARSGVVERRLTGQSQHAIGVAFAGNDMLISASRDRTVRLWDWPSGLPLLTLDVGSRQPCTLAVSNDARWAACTLEQGQVEVWDLGHYKRHVAGNASWNLGRYANGVAPATCGRLEEQLRREVPPDRATHAGFTRIH